MKIVLTDKEFLLMEINEAEQAMAHIAELTGLLPIIDPTETLGERIELLGRFIRQQGALLGAATARLADRSLDTFGGR